MNTNERPRYTLERGTICADGRRLLCFTRAAWGDGAPTHAELTAAECAVGEALSAPAAPLPALAWMIEAEAQYSAERLPDLEQHRPADARNELRDILAALDWLEACGVSMANARSDLPPEHDQARILAYVEPPPPPADPIRDALEAAERFISGFEGDELQDDLSALGKVRAALRSLKGGDQ